MLKQSSIRITKVLASLLVVFFSSISDSYSSEHKACCG